MATTKTGGGPAFPLRGWRGHVPLAEAPDSAAGAVAKPEGTAPAAPVAPATVVAAAPTAPAAPVPAPAAPAKASVEKVTLKPAEHLQRLTDVETKVTEKAQAVDAKLAQLDEKLERQRTKAVVSALRRMGADPAKVTDADLLLLAPKVDADDPTGLVELGKFRDARPGLFVPADVGPQEALGALTKSVQIGRASCRERV